MDTLLQKIKDFNKNQIDNYKRNNTIEIKFGRIITEEIFSLKLSNTTDLIKHFRNYKLSYSQGKVYKHKNGYYKTFNNKNNEMYNIELLEKKVVPYTNFDLLLVNNLMKSINIFPSRIDYEDEYSYDEVCIYVDKNVILKFETYNDLFSLKIIIELEKDLPYTYQDEVIENIKNILDLLRKLECN